MRIAPFRNRESEMRIWLGTAMAGATLALAACGSGADDTANGNAATAAANTASVAAEPIVGLWTGDAPVDFSGEGLRTRTTDERIRYAADGSFRYLARLIIFGPELPSEGLGFAVDGTGRWRRQGDQLTRDYGAVSVTPEHEDGELRRLSTQLGQEMVDEPATVSTVDRLEGNQLTLTTDDRAQNFTRR